MTVKTKVKVNGKTPGVVFFKLGQLPRPFRWWPPWAYACEFFGGGRQIQKIQTTRAVFQSRSSIRCCS